MVDKPMPLAMPSVEEMQQIMRSSGVLDKQTIFPEHDAEGVKAQTRTSTITLANAQIDVPVLKKEIEFTWLKKNIPRFVGFILTLQGLRGIYKSVVFIMVEFPELEQMLADHLITSEQINGFVSKAAITVISTIISMIFALRLTILKTKAAKVVSTLIGIGLIIGNTALNEYFNQQDSGVQFSMAAAEWLERLVHRVDLLLGRE